MSNQNNTSTVINDASKTLANLLFVNLANDPDLSSIFNSQASQESQVSLASPEEVKTEKSAKLSIYLYNVAEFSAMKNMPSPQPRQNPPVYLSLHYLVTPFTQDASNDQTILGKIIQTFVDYPVLRGTILQGNLIENGEDIRLTLDSLSIDDLNKLWTMLSTPLKLCCSCSVSPVRIDPSRLPGGSLVTQKVTTYKQKQPGDIS